MRPDSAESALGNVERRWRLLLALTTEQFTLRTARASTIADRSGRAALYP